MMTPQKAQKIYDDLANVIAARNAGGIYTAMGFSSNLDLAADFRIEILNELLAYHMPEADLKEMKPAVLIRTMKDFLETLVYFCLHGIGGEVDIENPELVSRCFPCKRAMGGTAVQAALALDQLGAGSVVHLTDDSKEVLEQLVTPNIKVPLSDGTLGGAEDVQGIHEQEVHVIMQFQKGCVIRLNGQEEEIPQSNRLILTKNTVNESLPLNEDYLHWVEQNARSVSSDVLSSFNCILDPELLKPCLERVKEHIDSYHKNNPDGIVYFEDAHYHDSTVRRMVIETLYPHVDIMSMNEEELEYTMKMYGHPVQIDDIFSCAECLEYLRDRFGIGRGVIVHTKDYAMFAGDAEGLEIEHGIVYGSLMATSRAAFGVYGSDQEIRSILCHPLNETGVHNMELIEKSDLKDRVVIVPTFSLDRPKYTIGLGDCFTGGMQLCF